jgi:formylglycine-generating enzyme required for sulfatase activity
VPLAFVRIPAGTFSMGSPSGERNRGDDEAQHQVTLTRDYYIGKFEVTQAQWQAVMGSNPSYFKSGGDYPVEQISWIDITEDGGFLARLNRHLTSTGQPGAGRMRLPTEAEWERAARGGTTTRFSYGDALDCDDFCKPCATHAQYMRWCGNNKPGRPDEVGRRKPNPFGLYDVHGDVFEWVQDWYGPYSSSAQKDPKGPWKGSDRVIRGGRSDSPAHWCRAAYRGIKSPDGRDAHTGLRLAWSP